MTQEDKQLLLKDLCARLPYKVKGVYARTDIKNLSICEITTHLYGEMEESFNGKEKYEFIPYLFPLSSMTSEQLFEVQEIMGKNEIEIEDGFFNIIDSSRNTITYLEILAVLEWFYKNHFDINGLIEKGLALDATGLNIY